jgi:hypothetical protein
MFVNYIDNMTLNITKKKIEKVLELFNQTRKRPVKRRGIKARRNKSYNKSKIGRKNIANKTLKQSGGGDEELSFKGFPMIGKPTLMEKTKIIHEFKKIMNDMNNEDKTILEFVDNNFSENTLSELTKEYDTLRETNANGEESELFEQSIKNVLITKTEAKKKTEAAAAAAAAAAKEAKIKTDDKSNEDKNTTNTVAQPQAEENTTTNVQPQANATEQTLTDVIKKDAAAKEAKKKTDDKSKQISSQDMLKVALASNYFTQYGILSGMLKMGESKNNNLDVMEHINDGKLYAEFCDKMGFTFTQTKQHNEEEEKEEKEETKEEEEEETN